MGVLLLGLGDGEVILVGHGGEEPVLEQGAHGCRRRKRRGEDGGKSASPLPFEGLMLLVAAKMREGRAGVDRERRHGWSFLMLHSYQTAWR